ncbi:GDSL-type esterase/lipase family protein [Clostridium felsineum]|uniref:Arylesterase n=1 Tax=Clostridium felsineum TaxID=36839 RepID=A0A1S8MCY0_9CLOT|nr:GDSL-type esterase/lipase family protein [Clostridium felsineum]URZ08568.1 Arylesterase [Clostridium felsineum]URZ13599.1 Arylesterase [Clostridium felsineum]URZ14440.1 Arylesterase [Clostridium felsineum DSM 794]
MKIVCFGDSLTYGYGVNSNSSWVSLLKTKLHNVTIINKGVNGDTTTGLLSRSHKDVIEENPDYVIIMAGTNDLLMNHSIELIEDNIKLLIKEAKENNITPILALQPPIVESLAKIYWDASLDYKKANSILLDYINWSKNYAKDNNITIISFYDYLINKPNITDLYSDGLHPNTIGHKLMFNTLYSSLINIIY